MKINFYCDIYEGQDLATGLWATTKPHAKSSGAKRYCFTVDIPDFNSDAYAPVHDVKEVDKNGS